MVAVGANLVFALKALAGGILCRAPMCAPAEVRHTRQGGHTGPLQFLKTVPVKRHKTLDRITANEICKQAGLSPKF
jgi:hypothetical protein